MQRVRYPVTVGVSLDKIKRRRHTMYPDFIAGHGFAVYFSNATNGLIQMSAVRRRKVTEPSLCNMGIGGSGAQVDSQRGGTQHAEQRVDKTTPGVEDFEIISGAWESMRRGRKAPSSLGGCYTLEEKLGLCPHRKFQVRYGAS